MKIAKYTGTQQIEVTEKQKPEITSDQILVKVAFCGICGSDVHAYQKGSPRRKPPMIMGHEASGEVVRCGDTVGNIECGDQVAVLPLFSCEKCKYCVADKENLCPDRAVLGVERDGTYAECFAVPADLAYRLPDSMSYTQAALVEPLAVAVHAVRSVQNRSAEKVAIIGAGVIGLFTLAVLKNSGVKNSIVMDIDDTKLDIARQLGADVTINTQREDPVEVIRRKYGGVEVCIEAVGLSATLNTAIHATENGGEVVVIGMTGNGLEVDMLDVVAREIQIRGTYCYTRQDFEHALNLLATAKIDPSLFTQTRPFSEAIDVFNCLADHKEGLVKVVLTV
jgi:L-iditol 2-dehydrogenase